MDKEAEQLKEMIRDIIEDLSQIGFARDHGDALELTPEFMQAAPVMIQSYIHYAATFKPDKARILCTMHPLKIAADALTAGILAELTLYKHEHLGIPLDKAALFDKDYAERLHRLILAMLLYDMNHGRPTWLMLSSIAAATVKALLGCQP